MAKHIIFVCTGNICRSPMAEGLMREKCKEASAWKIGSAGLAAGNDMPPSEHSVAVMAEIGIDISKQRSRLLTQDLIQQADFLFVMTYSHLDHILMLYPDASEKTFLVRQFVRDNTLLSKDISDPIGQGIEVYRRCRDEISQALDSLVSFIESH